MLPSLDDYLRAKNYINWLFPFLLLIKESFDPIAWDTQATPNQKVVALDLFSKKTLQYHLSLSTDILFWRNFQAFSLKKNFSQKLSSVSFWLIRPTNFM